MVTVLCLALIGTISLASCKVEEAVEEVAEASEYRMSFYIPLVHPYHEIVKTGIEAFSKDFGIDVLIKVGTDFTQEHENENVEGMIAQGYDAITMYPVDANGANGLYKELTDNGVYVLSYATSSNQPNTASFAVATDVYDAAKVACERLIQEMGEEGKIINIIESVEDPNTILRKKGVEEVVAEYPNVEILQEIVSGLGLEEATEAIGNVLSTKINDIDGMIATGYTPTLVSAALLTEVGDKRIKFVGIDDDPVVLDAIRDGFIDGSISQAPWGQGYISCLLMKYLLDGWTPKEYFVNSGVVVIDQDNADSYSEDVKDNVFKIMDTLEEVYLNPPAN
jgi:ribose transport system substrate-binding protein